MIAFMTANEAAEKWNISHRRVLTLCKENRIEDVAMLGNMWIIPIDAKKPEDARTLKYVQGEEKTVKPFLKWAGGKSQLLKAIQKYYPFGDSNFTKYAEPLVGGGAVLFDVLSKYDLKEIYIADSNSELINAYRVIRDDVETLIDLLRQMQQDFVPLNDEQRKEYYYAQRDKFNFLKEEKVFDTKQAALMIFLNKTCFNGLYRVNKKGQYNVPMGAYKNPLICDEKNLKAISKKLQKVEIVCGDYKSAKDFIDEKTFVYFDPPYRPLNHTSGFTAYTENSFTDNDQIALAEFVKEMDKKGAKILVSNSDPKNTDEEDEFFDDIYSSFIISRVNASRMINSDSKNRGKITELLISNF